MRGRHVECPIKYAYNQFVLFFLLYDSNHYSDAIMSAMASQITSFWSVCSAVCSDAQQRKHQSYTLQAFVRGIHRWPVDFPPKGPVTRKMFPFDDVIMTSIIVDSCDTFTSIHISHSIASLALGQSYDIQSASERNAGGYEWNQLNYVYILGGVTFNDIRHIKFLLFLFKSYLSCDEFRSGPFVHLVPVCRMSTLRCFDVLFHDDAIKWKHVPRYRSFVQGIHRSPHKGQWRGALMFSLICAWINGWANNRKAGDLRRHCAHYDLIVMRCPTKRRQWCKADMASL